MKKILLIVFLFFCCTNVYALERSFAGGEYIPGVAYMKYDGTTYYYRNAQVIRDTETNEVAYCISAFDGLVEYSSYTSRENYDSNFGISKANWEKIKLIAYYGYGYKDHTDIKWVSITQMLIWRTLYPDKTFEWIDNTTSKNIIKPYDNELSILSNLVNSHNTLPNMRNNVTYNLSSEVFLIDYNETLSNYEVKYSDFDVTKRNDGLMFNVGGTPRVGKIVLEKGGNTYQRSALYFYNSSSQSIIERGNITPITYEIKVRVANGRIVINKIDSETKGIIPLGEASLDGAVYELYGSRMNYITEKTIENKEIVFDNLTFGNYYVKEKKAGNGYKVDDTIYPIVLNENNIEGKLVLENKAIKYKLQVTKVDSESGNTIPQGEASLDGAIYSLYDSKMNHIEDKTIENNKLIFDNLLYGKYYIKEKSSGVGYYLDNNIYDVTINGNDEEKKITLANIAIKYKLTIKKVDSESGNTIPQGEASLDGAIYSLYDSKMNHIEDKIIENNELIFDNLPYGKYYIKEKSPGTGYYLDQNIYEVVLDNDLEKELILKNEVIKSKIKIIKYYGSQEEFDNNKMGKKNNAYFEVISQEGELIKTGYTNEEGILEFDLPYGQYVIRQLTSKDGYKKVDDYNLVVDETSSYSMELVFNDIKIEVPNANITIFDYLFGDLYG